MSLLIRYQQAGGLTNVIRSRSLHTRIGLDAHGLLKCAQVVQPWCSVYREDDTFLLVPESEQLHSDQHRLLPNQAVRLVDNFSCRFCDTTLTFFLSSGTAEALAETSDPSLTLAEIVDSPLYPKLSVALADLSVSTRLFPGVSYVVGSSPACAVYLPFPSIAPEHCSVTLSPDQASIQLTAHQGAVSCDELLAGHAVIGLPASFMLLPTRLLVRVSRS